MKAAHLREADFSHPGIHERNDQQHLRFAAEAVDHVIESLQRRATIGHADEELKILICPAVK